MRIERLQSSWYGLILPAAVIMALLVSVGLPALFPALSGTRFRVGLLLAVVVVFGSAAAWRAWRMRRGAATIADGMAQPEPGEADVAAISGRLREALAELRQASGKARGYLYVKPWYVIIGPPGAGKTTALRHSGLRFPHNKAVEGEGGTRNLDFWFSDGAVLVDTAGRYTTQDSDPKGDARGWARFLALLRRTRPREPINGVIVALGLDTLTADGRPELDRHVAAIRQRLHELHKALRVSVPVYLLLTKADLLAGFTDFFADLAAEGRRAVLGSTLSADEGVTAQQATAAFDRMTAAIDARAAKRLQDEPDPQRRSRILGFSAQLVTLRARVARFVEGILPEHGGDYRLRGVYLASGTQAGTPLDHLLAQIATVYEEEAPPSPTRGRAFFLNRLFTEVIFPEAGMVRAEAAMLRRRRLAQGAGFAAIGIAAIAMLVLWGGSFERNKGLQAAEFAGGRAASAEIAASGADLAEVRDGDPDLAQMLPVLDRLRGLPGGYADQAAGSPSWRMRLGLFQSGHARAAREAYLEALQRIMLPRLLLELERTLRSGRASPIRLYEPLKAYLMLGGYGGLDARAVKAWVLADWRDTALAGEDREDIRRRLSLHLDALLGESDLGRVWPEGRAPLDGALLAGTRAAIIALPLADRAYAMMRQRAAASGRPDWRAAAVLAQSDTRAFRNGSAVLALAVPWFFTRDGYAQGYRPALSAIGNELDRDLWVLGPDGSKASMRGQLSTIDDAVARDYARDYIAAWDAVLATPQAANYFGDSAALGSFSRSPSPLRVLVDQAVHNTRLSSGGGTVPSAPFDAGIAITAHFRPVAAFAHAGGGGSAPVEALVQAVRQAASASIASAAPGAALGGDAVRGQVASSLGDLSTAGVSAPPQLQAFVAQIGRTGRGAATRTAMTALNDQYMASVRPACRSASVNLYPFDSRSATDVTSTDFLRVYGSNGDIDGFVRSRLQPLLVTAQTGWRWRGDDPVAARFAPSSADAFRKASAIRDLAVGGLVVQVSVATMGPGVKAVDLAVGDTKYRIEAGDAAARPVVWTAAALPQAHLSLAAGKQTLFSVDRQGSFALFRLVAAGQMQDAGERAILVWYGPPDHRTALRIAYPTPDDPFARNGPFSFRCPERL